MPACCGCNSGFSKDDEYFKVSLGLRGRRAHHAGDPSQYRLCGVLQHHRRQPGSHRGDFSADRRRADAREIHHGHHVFLVRTDIPEAFGLGHCTVSVVFIVLPLALLIVGAAVGAFVWSARTGQFDDLDTPAVRVIHDDR